MSTSPKAPTLGTRSAHWSRTIAFFVIFALWLIWFWPVLIRHENLMGYGLLDPRVTGAPLSAVPHKSGAWPIREDTSLHLMFLPNQRFLARELRQARIPEWNPEIGCGQPVASDPQYHLFSPFFWLFLIDPSAWTFSVGIAIAALFGVLGFTIFLRESGFEWDVASLGGGLLALNPLTAQSLIVSNAWGYWCLGWALWGCERYINNRRFGLQLLVAGASAVMLVGHPVVGSFQLLILASYALYSDLGRATPWRLLRWGVAACATFGLCAVMAVPFLATLGHSWTYKELWDGGPYQNWWSIADPTSTIYLPLPLWGLTAVALLGSSEKVRYLFAAVAVVGLLIMFPWPGPGCLRWFLSFGMNLSAAYGEEAFRIGLAGLGVIGLKTVWRDSAAHRGVLLRALGYGLASHLLISWLASVHSFSQIAFLAYPQLALSEVSATLLLGLACVLNLEKRRIALLLGGVVLPLLPILGPMSPWRLATELDLTKPETAPAVVKRMLDADGASGRWRFSGEYLLRADGMPDLSPNQGLNWGLSDIRSNSPMLLRGFVDFAQHWQLNGTGQSQWLPRQNDQLLRFLGAKWLVQDLDRPLIKRWGMRRPCDLVLREISNPAPWARAVGTWQVEPLYSRQLTETFKLVEGETWRERVVLDHPPPLGQSRSGAWSEPTLTWLAQESDRMRWRLKGPSPSVLVVLQNAHPGWRATIDDRAVPILKAYATFQAVAVPPGTHDVEMSYHDPWFSAGAVISLVAWAALGISALWEYRRGGKGSKIESR